MKVREIPNKLLSLVGLKVIKLSSPRRPFPVEIAESDKRIFEYVRANALSTSTDERLFATIMACQHVVEKGIEGDFVECGVWRGGTP